MKTRNGITMASLFVLGVAAMAGSVYAQGVGNLPALPSVFPQLGTVPGWVIGGATGPIPVVLDPNGPKWLKHLTDPNGGLVVAQPGQVFTLSESLVVAGNLPWSDWHEEILTPGWEWLPPSLVLANGVPATNLAATYLPPTATAGGVVSFTFDPLAPGTLVDIRKQLEYVGVPGTVYIGPLDIAQYPTPEPGTLALLSLAGLAVLRRRRGAST